jgi:ABC-type Zn uptake system ZnuABC Zn-binding protein ZnuA
MRRLIAVIFIFIGLIILLMAFSGSGQPSTAVKNNLPIVAVTSYPLYDLAKAVGAGVVQVEQLIPPGAEPHTFEPKPSTVETAQRASVVYAIGYGFDSWADTLANSPPVTLAAGLKLRAPAEIFTDDAVSTESTNGVDPHYWLNVSNMTTMTTNLEADLAGRFPSGAAAIHANAKSYRALLAQTDQRIRAILAPETGRQLVTLHDAWYYFAASYGLKIAGTYEPTAGREPTPKYLQALNEAVAKTGVKTIFAEPGLAVPSLESFAQDQGLRIVTLDPGEGASKLPYVEMMIHDAEIIRDNQ